MSANSGLSGLKRDNSDPQVVREQAAYNIPEDMED